MEVTIPFEPSWQNRFVAGLDKAIDYHTHHIGENDRNNASTSVMLALIEVRDAFINAQKQESGWKS